MNAHQSKEGNEVYGLAIDMGGRPYPAYTKK
jgi:hypothetical protein